MPDNLIEQLAAALRLRDKGKAQEALQLLLDLYASFPDNPLVNYHCAATHDALGKEKEAIPFYERAIQHGLTGDELRGAFLGLGSSYRCVGQYAKAEMTLRHGLQKFPKARELEVFLAMALYNQKKHAEAMQLLLKNLGETTREPNLMRYQRAIVFYADKLDQLW
jgi:predicted Zn-dependent protease